MKKTTIFNVILIIFMIFQINITFWNNDNFNWVLYNKIYNEYYFNTDYVNDKYNLLNILLNDSIKWKEKVSLCLAFWKKYSGIDYQKDLCIIQIKHYLNIKNSKKYRNYNLLEWQFYKKNIDSYNTLLLKSVSKNNLLTEIEKKTIIYHINDNFRNNIIENDLKILIENYKINIWEDLIINSGYRSINDQKLLYNNFIEIYGINQNRASIPWSSEHHLWTVLDFKRDYNNYEWLKNNSYKYWFIQSYNNSDCLTKYWIQQEDWHYRWVWLHIAEKWKEWNTTNSDKCNIDFFWHINKKN